MKIIEKKYPICNREKEQGKVTFTIDFPRSHYLGET